MAQPTPYSRQYNFTNFQTVNPASPLPAAQVDLELNSIKSTLDKTLNNLKLIQRDDTALANASVGFDQLKGELNGFGFNPPTAWATTTSYAARDTVFQAARFYQCRISHVSGVFATDLAAGDWLLIADFNVNPVEVQTVSAAAVTTLGDTDLVANVQTTGPVLKKITWANLKTTIFNAWGSLIVLGTVKATPIDADAFAFMDSAAANATKVTTWASVKTTIWTALGPALAAFTGKTTPVDADGLLLTDSAASGASKVLTWANLRSNVLGGLVVRSQVFTSSGTYTPNANMVYCLIECVGGGGGGGGVAGASGNYGGGGGGGSGGRSMLVASAATIGASKTVTVGAAGAGGTAGNNAGGSGGDTGVGTLCIGKGGAGGGGSAGLNAAGGAGGVSGTGGITGTGQNGSSIAGSTAVGTQGIGGAGATSLWGSGGTANAASSGFTTTGGGAAGFGAGGAGGSSANTTSTAGGGAGVTGLVAITEYCSK